MEKIDNDWDEDGVPICSLDKCRQYDGKRCRLQGFRPDRICKPGVLVMLREQREKIVKLQGGES